MTRARPRRHRPTAERRHQRRSPPVFVHSPSRVELWLGEEKRYEEALFQRIELADDAMHVRLC